MKTFMAKNLPLNILILNAGVFLPPYSKTQQGFEARPKHPTATVLPTCHAAVSNFPYARGQGDA